MKIIKTSLLLERPLRLLLCMNASLFFLLNKLLYNFPWKFKAPILYFLFACEFDSVCKCNVALRQCQTTIDLPLNKKKKFVVSLRKTAAACCNIYISQVINIFSFAIFGLPEELRAVFRDRVPYFCEKICTIFGFSLCATNLCLIKVEL